MYFSLITPTAGREREAAHQRVHGAYADHQWLWQFFPAPAGTARDFIFRRHEGDGPPRFYAVSARPPESPHDAWQVQTRDYAPRVSTGTMLQFELRANPTVRHGHDGKSKRHDVVMEAKKKLLSARSLPNWAAWNAGDKPELYDLVQKSCGAWLQRRGEALGFAVDTGVLLAQAYQQQADASGRNLRFSTVDLSGQLTVTDGQAFAGALLQGIGAAKAFGCGLLLVRAPEGSS